jgi:hypothetical protein
MRHHVFASGHKMSVVVWPHSELKDIDSLGDPIYIGDHLGGFDQDLRNPQLELINAHAAKSGKIRTVVNVSGFITPAAKAHYPWLDIRTMFSEQYLVDYQPIFDSYPTSLPVDFNNFACSFNGTSHVSRQLLVAIMHKFGMFDPKYSSKNFAFSKDNLDGLLIELAGDRESFYRKFFVSENSEEFFQSASIHSTKHITQTDQVLQAGQPMKLDSFKHTRFDHPNNIYQLEDKLTQSFVHIVSETMATSYHPFVTEKIFYSVATRGLFVAYAQPGWHAHVEKYYGFKTYNKIFDYRFDNIQNPVERLVELIAMLYKFKHLSKADLHDLYLIEQDTIEYNYDHAYSGNLLTHGLKNQDYQIDSN